MIDTNIAIHARDGDDGVLEQLALHDGAVMLSSLSLAELERGVNKDPSRSSLRSARLSILLDHLPVVPFDGVAAKRYGQIIAQCGWARGRDFDRMIAGHALSLSATLVTNNERDFSDIPQLSIENWLK